MGADGSWWDLPDLAIKGRRVEPEWRKRRQVKRNRRFVKVDWGELAPTLVQLKTDHAVRLLNVLYLRRNLTTVKASDGWIELVRHELETVELLGGHLNRAVARLERAGVVEVQRGRASGHCCG